jgi:zinc-ribbon domain/Putative zinc-binding metallo-peptidase
MQLFECQHCGQLLYFENTRCERCGHDLGYVPESSVLSAVEWENSGCWRPLANPERPSRFCANTVHRACNWLLPAGSPEMFCRACRLNRTIPNLGVSEYLRRWQQLERAKHRLVYGLLRLDLPLVGRAEDPETGLAFDFLAGSGRGSPEPADIITGHVLGLITIDIAEADDAERERHRQDMAETFRRCSDTSATKSGIITGIVSSEAASGWRRSAACSATSVRITGPACRHTMPRARGLTGSSISLAATPALIPGRISQRPGRITCILSMRWRRLTRSACASAPKPAAIQRSPLRSTSILTAKATSTCWSARGYRSPMPSTASTTVWASRIFTRFVLAPTVMGKLRFIHGLVHPGVAEVARAFR